MRIVEKDYFLSLVLGLVGINGCSKVEKESKEAILSTLKDPDSAQFQNIKGYCGEVNSKNSYGGYSICNNLGSTLHSK
ncbi:MULTISPECIES: hypothetical protein [Acinetobacter]|uniref:hypothetical protein n=1 Tax=Acinetobacter TaxID=469 RepID=UPI001D179782|nr:MULTISPECIES: hypothetical protein [Acinetobacter]